MRTISRLLLLCPVLLAACGGGSGGDGPVDLVDFVAPSTARAVEIGTTLTVQVRPVRGEAGATLDLFADGDADLGTTGDRVTIATGRAVTVNVVDSVDWDTTGVAPGGYWLVVRLNEGGSSRTEAGPRLSLGDPDALVFQPDTLTPDAQIQTTDPLDANFWLPVVADGTGDVPGGELDLTQVEVSQTLLEVSFRLTVVSTVTQQLLRSDTVFFGVFDEVRIGTRRGQFWIRSDGNSSTGFSVFLPEGGSFNELLFYPVDVSANDQGEVTLSVPVEHFAFDADAGESSDFTVWWAVQRRVGNTVAVNDVSAMRVVRFLK